MSGYSGIKEVLSVTMAEDLQWLSHGRVPGQKPDPVNNPWMPFQMAEFVAIMTECVAESEGNQFLDVGSGIGTKTLVASELFGMASRGIEYDEKMASYAAVEKGRGLVYVGDALTAPDYYYETPDIIWMYRPYRDGFKQAQLEHRIFTLMKPGAIIAGAQWENQPNDFEIIIDDWDTGRRGAWKKPLNWEVISYDIDMDEQDAA